MTQYHTRIQGKEAGPYTAAEIKEMAATGALRPDDYLTPDGTKWFRADRAKNLVFASPHQGEAEPEIPLASLANTSEPKPEPGVQPDAETKTTPANNSPGAHPVGQSEQAEGDESPPYAELASQKMSEKWPRLSRWSLRAASEIQRLGLVAYNRISLMAERALRWGAGRTADRWPRVSHGLAVASLPDYRPQVVMGSVVLLFGFLVITGSVVFASIGGKTKKHFVELGSTTIIEITLPGDFIPESTSRETRSNNQQTFRRKGHEISIRRGDLGRLEKIDEKTASDVLSRPRVEYSAVLPLNVWVGCHTRMDGGSPCIHPRGDISKPCSPVLRQEFRYA